MVGPWPLAPHHDHLQYIHHIHLMQRGQNRGVTINSQLPCIYGGRNNNVLNHFWWNLILKVKNKGNNGGIMMYNYGLDHRELGEHFLVLTRVI